MAKQGDREPGKGVGLRNRRLLKVGGLMLLLVGIHAALFQALVGAAGERVQALEQEHGAERLDGAKKPGTAPSAESPTFAAWRDEEALWHAARERDEARARRRLLGTAILVSCGVQVLLLLVIGLRVLRAR